MAKFSSLEATAANMRQIEPDIEKMSDANLKALKKTISKNDIKLDLSRAKGWRLGSTDDMADLDDLVDKYETELKQALMYRQLFYHYSEKHTGEGSRAYEKMRYYQKAYDRERDRFSGYTLEHDYGAFQTLRITRG